MKTMTRNLILPILILTASLCQGLDIPYLTGRVTDNADIISSTAEQSLSDLLKDHEDQTSNQIAVLTVPTLQGENIEEYANKVFEEWKLGQEDKDNGILIVVAPNDRRMRIEVGYGLEPTLTDGTAGLIIRSIMTPKFKNGDFEGGITEGAQAVIAVLDGDELTGLDEAEEESSLSNFEGPDLALKERLLFGAFIFGIIGLFTFLGICTPGGGSWFLYFFLIPFWAMFPIVVLGTSGALKALIIYLIGFPLAKLFVRNKKWYKKAAKDIKKKGRASVGGFMISSGGSGSSWSSGGSSFSGGGGSSGGGGASGSW